MSLRAQRHKGNGEIVESRYLNAVDLKVHESPSSYGDLCALSERAETCLFLQVPVFKLEELASIRYFGHQSYSSAPYCYP